MATAQRAADELAQRLATTTETHAGELSESRGKVFALTEELATVRNDLAALEQQQEQTVGQQRTELDQARQTLAEVRTEFSAATAAAAREKQALEGQIADAQGRIAALERDLETEHSRAVQGLAEAQQKSEETLAAQRKQFEEARVADPQVQAPGPALVQSPTATQTQGLVDRYAQLQAQQTDRGMLVSLAEQQLHFASGGTSLPKGAIPSLDQIAALLKEFPNLAAVIEGHTDSSGPDTVNLTLSKARAESVRQGLIARGVAPQRLTATGLGEAKPVADNTTAPGRLKNRRVEILVIEPAP